MDMKKLLLISVSLFALGASANAADLASLPYTKAPLAPGLGYDWSGFYVGINGGGGLAHSSWEMVNALGVTVAPAVSEGRHNASGGTVGGQIGYRWQVSKWVFGVEAQGNWADMSGSNVSLALAPLTNQSKIDAFGLFTGQIGWTTNSLLFYGKAGGAVAHDKYNSFVPGGVTIGGVSQTRWGATMGVGVDFAFAANWSVGGEYDHLFLGHHSVDVAKPAGSRSDRIGQDADVALIRLNYRWGGPVIAKY
jgi:outer membrane immunogenic protein